MLHLLVPFRLSKQRQFVTHMLLMRTCCCERENFVMFTCTVVDVRACFMFLSSTAILSGPPCQNSAILLRAFSVGLYVSGNFLVAVQRTSDLSVLVLETSPFHYNGSPLSIMFLGHVEVDRVAFSCCCSLSCFRLPGHRQFVSNFVLTRQLPAFRL